MEILQTFLSYFFDFFSGMFKKKKRILVAKGGRTKDGRYSKVTSHFRKIPPKPKTPYQVYNPYWGQWVVIDANTDKIIKTKQNDKRIPFKGIPRGYRPPKKKKGGLSRGW